MDHAGRLPERLVRVMFHPSAIERLSRRPGFVEAWIATASKPSGLTSVTGVLTHVFDLETAYGTVRITTELSNDPRAIKFSSSRLLQ
jgi:hypothetical protein